MRVEYIETLVIRMTVLVLTVLHSINVGRLLIGKRYEVFY